MIALAPARRFTLPTVLLAGLLSPTGCNSAKPAPAAHAMPEATSIPAPAPDPTPAPAPDPPRPPASEGVRTAAAAAPTDEPAPSALIAMYPSLRTAPAPAVVTAGLRVTYHAASGYSTSMFSLLKDEPIPVDQLPFVPFDRAGMGLEQVDIVALDREAAVLEVRDHLLLSARPEAPVLSGTAGFVTAPGVGGGYWVNPEALKRAIGRSGPNVLVQRLRWTTQYAQKTYSVIGVSYRRPGLNYINLYDERTGLMVLFSTFSERRDRGGRYHHALTRVELVDHRTVDYPWVGHPAPAWLATVQQLDYRGDVTTPSTMPGRPDFTRPCEARAEVTHRGADWIWCAVSTSIGGAVGSGVVVSGPAQVGGLWLPPTGLRGLRAGQVIDRDPLTKCEVSVAAVGRNAVGREVVVLASVSPLQRTEWTFNRRTGMLLASDRVDKHLQNQRTCLTLGAAD